MSRQLTLFRDRPEKWAALEAAELPGCRSRRTAETVRALIWAIETLPDDSRTVEMFAARMDASQRNVMRAILTAERAGWIEIVRRPGQISEYRIEWNRIDPKHGAVISDPVARTDARPGLAPGGWPIVITVNVLADASRVQRLYEFALERGWVELSDREGFFAVAIALVALRGAPNPGARFTTAVKAKSWSVGSAQQWEQARQTIARLDGPRVEYSPPAVETPAVTSTTSEVDRRRKAEETRRKLLGSR